MRRHSVKLLFGLATAFAVLLVMAGIRKPATASRAVESGPSVIATISVAPGGNEPVDVAVNPVTHRIYTANMGSNNVSVIDASSNEVITNVAVGQYPGAIAVDPNINRIYALSGYDESLSVIDGDTNAVVTTIPLGFASDGLAVDPVNHRVYVSGVAVVDGITNTVVARVLIYQPCDSQALLAVNPVTDRVYVASRNGWVCVLDGLDNSYTGISFYGDSVVGVAVNPATNRVYATANYSSRVYMIDGDTNTVLATLSVGSRLGGYCPVHVVANPDTNRVYVANGCSHDIWVIDGDTNTLSTIVPVGSTPYGIAVDPTANRIYVANELTNTVAVVRDVVVPAPTVTHTPTITLTQTPVPPTPAPTRTFTPTPRGVGGVVMLPPAAMGDTPKGTSGSDGPPVAMWLALAGAVTGALAIGGCARARRRSK